MLRHGGRLPAVCGIAGVLRRDGRPIPRHWQTLLDEAIAPRGPDTGGRFHDRIETGDETIEVLLLHRRLSVIDHAGGAQPMTVAGEEGDATVALAFNGCIYDNATLRADLKGGGMRFRSDHSDTETLLGAYLRWGSDLGRHVDGMYAAAIWDRRSAELVLLRDLFGQKPLYVLDLHPAGDGLVFCSCAAPLRVIAAELGLAAAPSVAALQRYLQLGYVHGDDATLLSPVQQLPPLTACWRPPPEVLHGDPLDAVEEALEASVAAHLEADVPLGCFLSGGVDSSLVAVYAQRALGNLHTFCVRMDDPQYDESIHAASVASHLGTAHETLDVDPHPAADLLSLVAALGQPFADSSILPMYWISRAARRVVTVALSGDGGDELFLGYQRYQAAPWLANLHPLLALLPQSLLSAPPRSTRHRIGRMGRAARNWHAMGEASIAALHTRDEIEGMTAAPANDLHGPRRSLRGAIHRLQRFDQDAYLPDDLLRKVDTASMAVALEVRAPFLTPRVSSVAAGLTPAQLQRGGRKGLLRAVARRHLPASIVDRPKMGFTLPLGRWFRGDQGGLAQLLGDTLSDRDAFSGLAIDRRVPLAMLDEHRSGRRHREHQLFALLTLALWWKDQSSIVAA